MPRNLPPFVWLKSISIPFSEDESDGTKCRIGKWNGLAWSNGHVMFKGKPPKGSKGYKTEFKYPLSKIIPDAPEVFPVAVCEPTWSASGMLVFFTGGLVLNAKYFYYTLKKYPDAIFFGILSPSNVAPIAVKSKGKPVALLMPVWDRGNKWPREVVKLASARERLGAATDAPKPRREPKKQKSRDSK